MKDYIWKLGKKDCIWKSGDERLCMKIRQGLCMKVRQWKIIYKSQAVKDCKWKSSQKSDYKGVIIVRQKQTMREEH